MQRWTIAPGRWAKTSVLAVSVLLGGATGCTLPDLLFRQPPAPSSRAAQAEAPGGFTVMALPAYRLLVAPAPDDLPSRLLVIRLQLSTTDEHALSVALDDIAIVLPSGERRPIFDRGRAMELVRRTTLADAEHPYAPANGEHSPGRLSEFARLQLTDMVLENLLTDGVVNSEQPMQGFVVVDTGVPLMSLDGASIDVTAYRVSDASPANAAYHFAAPEAAEAP
jgi:hypothetical protein